MKVFEIMPEMRSGNYVYRVVVPVPDDTSDGLLLFDGSPKANRWDATKRSVKYLDMDRPLASFLPCTRDSTFAVLEPSKLETTPLLEACGELLGVRAPGGVELAIANIAPAVKCLDAQNSGGKRFPDGTLMYIDKYVFLPDKLPSCSIFKCAEESYKIFALDTGDNRHDFKAVVERNNYAGLSFREVWTDEG